MALTTTLGLTLTTTELLTNPDLNAGSTLIHSGFNVNRTLTATSTPDVTAAAYETFTMTAGAVSMDLTNLVLNAATVTLTGKKPRGLIVTNPSTNAAALTVVKGASNGYGGMGSSFSVTLQVGQSFMFDFYTAASAVGSGAKTLDVTGTGTDSVLLSVVAGT